MTFGHCWLSPFPGWQIEANFSKRRGPRKAIRICRSRPANFWCSAPQLPTHNGLGKGYQKYHFLIPGHLRLGFIGCCTLYYTSIWRQKCTYLFPAIHWHQKGQNMSGFSRSHRTPFFNGIQNFWLPQVIDTVMCIKVHRIVSLWCKTALGEVGVSLPWDATPLVLLAPG